MRLRGQVPGGRRARFGVGLILLAAVSLPALALDQNLITTVAGNGTVSGTAFSLSLYPQGIVGAPGGVVYFSDPWHDAVLRLDPDGQVTVIAGTGWYGIGGDGGLATETPLAYPTGLALDAQGDLLIAEAYGHRIRRVDLYTGVITTVAGTGTAGFSGDGGPAVGAQLKNPWGLALTASGDLLVADLSNHRIRRIEHATGIITTVAGSGPEGGYGYSGDGGPATGARLSGPHDVAVDDAGSFYIADTYNNRIRRVDSATQIITTVAGGPISGFGGDGGPATDARLNIPTSVELDASGNLLFSDQLNHRIRRVDRASGVISTLAGTGSQSFSGDGGPAAAAGLASPQGLARDSDGNLLVADSGNYRLRRIEWATGLISTKAGNGHASYSGDGGPALASRLLDPIEMAVDSAGNLLIVDQGNNCIRRIDVTTGVIITVAGNGEAGFSGDGGPATAARLKTPTGVALDGQGNLFIVDSANKRIRRVDAVTGIISTFAGGGTSVADGIPASQARLEQPRGIVLDPDGIVLVSEIQTGSVRSIDPSTGIIGTRAGKGSPYTGDENVPATSIYLWGPAGMAIGPSGDLYIAESGRGRARRVDRQTGIISTVAGFYHDDYIQLPRGDGGPALFAVTNPQDVDVDAAGNIFIAEKLDGTIRKVDAATGVITTVAGGGNRYEDGIPATEALLNPPLGIALDGTGALLIGDGNTDRVRRTTTGVVGNPPHIRSFSVSRERKLFSCTDRVDLCILDLCIGEFVNSVTVEVDLVTATAEVEDLDQPEDHLQVTLGFRDPPATFPIRPHSLELYDTGPTPIGELGPPYATVPMDLFSGDQAAADGIYTRRFYFSTTTTASPSNCVEETDRTAQGGTYTNYVSLSDLDYSGSAEFLFWAEALDSQGNGTAVSTPALLQGRFVDANQSSIPCGPPPIPGGPGCTAAPSDTPPVAKASAESSVPCTSPAGGIVALDGSLSTDVDSTPGTHDDIVSFVWSEYAAGGSRQLGTGERIEVSLSLGYHSVTLVVTDRAGAHDFASLSVQVVDPVLSDQDGDGHGDACDVCPASPDPAQSDVDHDGQGDYCDECTDPDADGFGNPGFPFAACPVDNCPSTSNPLQSDLDGDGLGDQCDSCREDPRNDEDHDGACASVDNCPTAPNYDQHDADHDGVGDACDSCTDTDRDGFGNPNYSASTCVLDNCPLQANPLQDDADGDGVGDLCDPCTDPDHDGFGDPLSARTCQPDNCPTMANSGQEDLDGDGAGDACDGCPMDAGRQSGPPEECGPSPIITTVAGGGIFPVDFEALAAGLYAGNLTIDPQGRLVIASDRIYRLEGGWLRGIAGNGLWGAEFSGDGGPAIESTIGGGALAYDRQGNLYFADTEFNRIRKVDAVTGIISTVAGSGSPGFRNEPLGDGGSALAASLYSPTGVALDADGNIFIADSGHYVIRRVVTATGVIHTVAGTAWVQGRFGESSRATEAQFQFPSEIALDGRGNLLILDQGNSCVRRVHLETGYIYTVAGICGPINGYSGDNGPADQARLNNPGGITVDAEGNLFIADSQNNRVRRVDAVSRIIRTVAGTGTSGFSGDGGPALSAQLAHPEFVAVGANGDLFVSDSSNDRVRRIDSATGLISTVAGMGLAGYYGDGVPGTEGILWAPQTVAIGPGGDLYFADAGNYMIRRVGARDRRVTRVAGDGRRRFGGDGGPAREAGFIYPYGLAVDGSGNLYVADRYDYRVRRISAGTGIITTVAGNGRPGFDGDGGPATSASLSTLWGVAVDEGGNLFIADEENHRVRRVDAVTGVISTVVGTGEIGRTGDGGPAIGARLDHPREVALDAAGNLYIWDSGNNLVRRVEAATGLIATIAGGGSSTRGGIPATEAQLYITGMAVNAQGDLFISSGLRIWRVDAGSGLLTAAGGNGEQGFAGDGGPALQGAFAQALGIAATAKGTLFIADSWNRRIRRIGRPCNDSDGDGAGDPDLGSPDCGVDTCPDLPEPSQHDEDDDGLGDRCDACPRDAGNDSDRDGLCADADNCPESPNPGQLDRDHDGTGDACDSCTDSDGDGYGDPGAAGNACPRDNCPDSPNAGQEDTDADGSGDACDRCPFDAANDADSDGWCGDADNCPVRANADQADLDGDSRGDACDNCPREANSGQADGDQDGTGDACDVCPTFADPGQGDADGDRIGDACDNCPGAANSSQADGNGDGAGDACQPSLTAGEFRAIREGVMGLSVVAADPQGEPLRGTIEFHSARRVPLDLPDAFLHSDCGEGFLLEGIPGEGIGFTYAGAGAPYIFDLDSNLSCADMVQDYELALGGCDDPQSSFEGALLLEGIDLPATVCVRRFGGTGVALDLRIDRLDPDRMTGELYYPEALALRIPFAGRLTRQVDLAPLENGGEYRFQLTVSDDVTPAVSLERRFVHHGETTLILNTPPEPRISPVPNGECVAGTGTVDLDGTGSADPDSTPGTRDDIVSYEWFIGRGTSGERLLGAGERIPGILPLGDHQVTLRARDSLGEEGEVSVSVRIDDTTAPTLQCPDRAEAECATPSGTPVSVRASAFDACSGAVTVVNDFNAGGADASGSYPLGTTAVTFRTVDPSGNAARCDSMVEVRDTLAPRITVRPSAGVLWPPNHQMVPVEMSVEAVDACGTATVILLAASSGEPDDAPGPGDGNTLRDIQGADPGTPDFSFSLRAERDGGGSGRAYALTYQARDLAGNLAENSVAVIVPHDQGGVGDPISLTAAPEGDRTALYWAPVPGAISYSVIRGETSSLKIREESIDLGGVTCLAGSGPDLGSRSREDTGVPSPGHAYFYLVAYDDGRPSSYGAATAPKPRTPASGGCEAPVAEGAGAPDGTVRTGAAVQAR